MKIIIFGASGFLGEKIFNELSKEHEVIGTCFSSEENSLSKIDASNFNEVNSFLKTQKPNIVIDAIALSSSLDCERNPNKCKRINYITAKNIAQSCNEINAKMIFISSSYVFDGEKGDYFEEDKENPKNEYSRWKVEAEKEVSKLNDYLILRIDLLFGVYKRKIRFGTRLLDKNKIELGFPNQIRSPIFSNDVPKMIKGLIKKNQKGVFHLSYLEKISSVEFIKKLFQISGMKEKIEMVDSSNWIVKSPKDSSLNPSKIISIGININSLEEGLNQLKEEINHQK